MSIAEKLVTIAENEQRVFEAGEAKGTLETAKICLGKEYPATYKIPDGVNRFGTFAMAYSTGLRYLTIPASVNFVANSAIRDISSLREVIFEGGTINTFGSSVFANDTALTKVYFGCEIATVNTISNGNFNNCTSLEELTFTQAELNGNLYIQNTAVLKKQCAYDIMRRLRDYSGTANDFVYTFKLHDTVWANVEDTTAEDYEAPPSYTTWKEYVTSLGYNI